MKEYIFAVHEKTHDAIGLSVGQIRRHSKELIRCKDCRHRPTEIEEDGETYIEFPEGSRCPCHCEDQYYNWIPEDDWFCGNGERSKE